MPPPYTADHIPDTKSEATYVETPRMTTPYQHELDDLSHRLRDSQPTHPRGYPDDEYLRWRYATQTEAMPGPVQNSKKNRIYGTMCCGSPWGICGWILFAAGLAGVISILLVKAFNPDAFGHHTEPTSSVSSSIATITSTVEPSTMTVTISSSAPSVSTTTASTTTTETETTVSTATETTYSQPPETSTVTYTPPTTATETETELSTSVSTATLTTRVGESSIRTTTILSTVTSTPPSAVLTTVTTKVTETRSNQPEQIRARQSSDNDGDDDGDNDDSDREHKARSLSSPDPNVKPTPTTTPTAGVTLVAGVIRPNPHQASLPPLPNVPAMTTMTVSPLPYTHRRPKPTNTNAPPRPPTLNPRADPSCPKVIMFNNLDCAAHKVSCVVALLGIGGGLGLIFMAMFWCCVVCVYPRRNKEARALHKARREAWKMIRAEMGGFGGGPPFGGGGGPQPVEEESPEPRERRKRRRRSRS